MIWISIYEANFLVQIPLNTLQYPSRVYSNGPYIAALLLFFFHRTSFPEGASRLPLGDIFPERHLKPQTNKKKTKYFFINHQSRKIKLLLRKTAVSQRTIILLSLFHLHLFNFTAHRCVQIFSIYCSQYQSQIKNLYKIYFLFSTVINSTIISPINIHKNFHKFTNIGYYPGYQRHVKFY